MRDAENIMFDLYNYYSTNLNTKISAITSEKADGLSLSTIDSNAFFIFPYDDDAVIANYNPIFIFSLKDSVSIPRQRHTSVDLVFYASIFTTINKNADNLESVRRLLRYSRALREVAQDASKEVGFTELNIQEVPPFGPFPITESDQLYNGVGVQFVTTFVG